MEPKVQGYNGHPLRGPWTHQTLLAPLSAALSLSLCARDPCPLRDIVTPSLRKTLSRVQFPQGPV